MQFMFWLTAVLQVTSGLNRTKTAYPRTLLPNWTWVRTQQTWNLHHFANAFRSSCRVIFLLMIPSLNSSYQTFQKKVSKTKSPILRSRRSWVGRRCSSARTTQSRGSSLKSPGIWRRRMASWKLGHFTVGTGPNHFTFSRCCRKALFGKRDLGRKIWTVRPKRAK